MSVAQLLSGTPAGLASASIVTNAITGFSGEILTIQAPGTSIDLQHGVGGYGVNISNTDGSGTCHLSLVGRPGQTFVQWVDRPIAGPSRDTYEDWGYDGPTQFRYTQYVPVADCSGGNGNDNGAVLLNWGMLDDARLGLLTGDASVVACESITAADVVLFTPNTISPATLAATGIAAPTYTIQPGVSFTLSAPMPVGEAWNYMVVRGGGPVA
jgi:hypothetical protein